MQKWLYGYVNLDKLFSLAILTFPFTLVPLVCLDISASQQGFCILLINAKIKATSKLDHRP